MAALLAMAVAGTTCVTPGPHAGATDASAGAMPVAAGAAAPLRSLGALPHPAAAALQARALQDINRMLVEGDAVFDPAQAAACQVSHPGRKASEQARAAGYAEPAPPLSYTVSMVSGACPTQQDPQGELAFDGPVDYIEHKHDRQDISPDLYWDTIRATRVSAVYVQGQAVGERTELRRLHQKGYHRLQSGEVIQQKAQGHDFDKPVYQAVYAVQDGQGGQLRPTVTFTSPDWQARPPKVSVFVAEQTGPGRVQTTQFDDGQRKQLMRMRDGMLHGWTEYFDASLVRLLGSNRQCYQHGQLLKATQCPD